MIRRLIGIVVALLAAWLGLAAPGYAEPVATAAPPQIYTYDGHHASVESTADVSERGPPRSRHAITTPDAVDRRSRGTSARPSGGAATENTAYDQAATLVQGARLTPTAGAQVGATGCDRLSLQRPVSAANAGDDVVRALSATERRTLDDALRPDKLDHIFDPKHNFEPLVQQYGSREAAMEQIVRSIGGPLPQAGRFEMAQSIGGQTVVIRGAVVDGVPRIGTAFTP